MTDIARPETPIEPTTDDKPGRLEFPYNRIVGNSTLEGLVARFALFGIPLEFYVVTHFPGGLTKDNDVAIILISLLTVVAVLVVSLVVALVPGRHTLAYINRLRVWSVCLLLNWAFALALLAVGYAAMDAARYQAEYPDKFPSDYDLLAYWLFRWPLNLDSVNFGQYPGFLRPGTYLIYVCYGILATLVVRAIARIFGRDPQGLRLRGPNAILVTLLSALVMMLVHGLTRLP